MTPDRKESVTPESLARIAFGPLWQPPHPKRPALDPDPPGEVWRRVPGWAAYEVSPTGLVRSYHVRRAGLAAVPQRLLRPVQDPEIGPSVTLCDGHGGRKKITIAELVRLVYPELAPEAGSDPSPTPPGHEPGDDSRLRTSAGQDSHAPRSGPAEEIIAWIERHLGVKSS